MAGCPLFGYFFGASKKVTRHQGEKVIVITQIILKKMNFFDYRLYKSTLGKKHAFVVRCTGYLFQSL